MAKLIRSINKNFYEFTGTIKFETDKAILFDDGGREVWLPRSQIEDIDLEANAPLATVTLPEWLAYDKELI